jgi:hypothetical protein
MIYSYLKGLTSRLSRDLRSAPTGVAPTFISVIIFFYQSEFYQRKFGKEKYSWSRIIRWKRGFVHYYYTNPGL